MFKLFKASEYLKRDSLPVAGLILIEIFAIILAVTLGFWANEWRENRQKQAVVEKAKQSLAAEMMYNQERMTSIYDYYDVILTGIRDTVQANPNLDVMNTYAYQIPHFRGAMPPMLRSSSYEMLLTSGIMKDFEFETADLLSVIYNFQSLLQKLDDAMIIGFADDSGFTRISNIRHKFGLYNELIPVVLAFYKEYGVALLGDYGFEFQVTNEKLLEFIKMQGVQYSEM